MNWKIPGIILKYMLIVLTMPAISLAIDYGENLSTLELETRAQKLYALIRCPTCNGQSIESSMSQTAYDIRQVVRIALEQGRSDAEIMIHLKKCYGESVSFAPSLNLTTAPLWGLPFLLPLLGGVILYWRVKRF